ncbi:hypothetical protein [Bacillus sp. 2205SS5-2]|uniref:hypothetical protein n=1 Tax=Bacillus sp. 2205SS5-2 TaxID=3109031 RepID=UPI00300788BA
MNHTADKANDIVKSVSGEGGIIGKVSDTSADLVKNVSKTGNDVVGKTVDSASNVFKGVKQKLTRKKE